MPPRTNTDASCAHAHNGSTFARTIEITRQVAAGGDLRTNAKKITMIKSFYHENNDQQTRSQVTHYDVGFLNLVLSRDAYRTIIAFTNGFYLIEKQKIKRKFNMAPIRTTDQVFKGIMKQENTDDRLFYRIIKEDFDEADHHNDSQLLQKGTETEEKRNTVDTTIKTEMDSIKGYEFQGTVKNEKNYSECIGLINLDLTSNCIHIGEKQYTCDICGQHCLQKPNLRRHLKTHIVKKVYKCDTCDQAFSRVFNLRVHRRAHTGEKPHKCVICNQAFTRAYTLKLHERIHTGEKPHKCEICARAFSRIFNLRVHKKVHTGEKPYKCDICDQAFSRLYRLKIHTRKHTG